ncbi:MAG: signal peptidase II [Planctomycetota bacterium]
MPETPSAAPGAAAAADHAPDGPLPINRVAVFVTLAVGGLALDLWSKSAVFAWLGAPDGSTGWLLDGWVKYRFYTTFNEGALWGVGQGFTWAFALFSVVAAAGVIYWLFVAGAARSWWLTVSLAFVMAGTLGNLYDRLGLHGEVDAAGVARAAVRDFFHFRLGTFDWAIFNVADVFLVTGAIMLGLQSFAAEAAARPAATDRKNEFGDAVGRAA